MMIAPAAAPGLPRARIVRPLIARIEHRAARAPFLRTVRAAAASRAITSEDLRFFALAYVAGLILFLSWLA